MHKHLDLATAALYDGTDILNRKFASEHYTRKTKFLEGKHPFEIVRNELRGGVNRQGWEMLTYDTRHTDILNNEGVRRDLLKYGESFYGVLEFCIGKQCIESNIHLAPLSSGVGHQFGKLSSREIDGLSSRRKHIQTKIHGIGARFESGKCRFKRPGRSQKFNGIHIVICMHCLIFKMKHEGCIRRQRQS